MDTLPFKEGEPAPEGYHLVRDPDGRSYWGRPDASELAASHFYCDRCEKVIPKGQPYLEISIAKAMVIPDDGSIDILGAANIVACWHLECVPANVTMDLSRWQNQ